MRLSPQERKRLLIIVLRFFLQNGAQGIGDLRCHPPVAGYSPRFLSDLVSAMLLCGLLDDYGATSGRTYYTSHLGWIVLATLDEHIDGKVEESR